MSNVTITNHPLIQHKLHILRDKNTPSTEFRMLVSEIAMLLCYEATRNLELEPVEDFRTVKHTTGLNEGLARVEELEIRMFLKKVNGKARDRGFHDGLNRIKFKAPRDRYAGQLKELARILRGEIPNPPGLYRHDLLVHKVSLDACNL